nr:hypothetical protein CFP56_12109 [Quercus suber]
MDVGHAAKPKSTSLHCRHQLGLMWCPGILDLTADEVQAGAVDRSTRKSESRDYVATVPVASHWPLCCPDLTTPSPMARCQFIFDTSDWGIAYHIPDTTLLPCCSSCWSIISLLGSPQQLLDWRPIWQPHRNPLVTESSAEYYATNEVPLYFVDQFRVAYMF